MRIAILSALLFAPAGGTIVRIPLEREGDAKKLLEKVRALELEVYSCCGKDFTEKWRYDACVHCGKDLKPERKKAQFYRAVVEDGALEILSRGDIEGLVVVRLSDLERCFDAAGYRAKKAGFLRGPFALHVEDADKAVAEIRKIEGVLTAEAKGGAIYVNQGDRDGSKVSFQALGKVGDVSWVISQCHGLMGFTE